MGTNWSSVLLTVLVAGCLLGNGSGSQAPRKTAGAKRAESALNKTGTVAFAGVEFALPSGVTSKKDSPVADFSLVEFEHGGQMILRIYAGNSPAFPSGPCREGPRKQTPLGAFVAVEAACPANSPFYKEFLIELEQRWPHFLHVMQPDRDRDLGDAILKSIKASAR